nr:hypothetical transcript [Hymenolepis microstoma]
MNLKPLEKMVTCPIDFNFLEDPRLLPCGHVLSPHCLDSYIRQILTLPPSKRRVPVVRPQLSSPICRALHNIPESNIVRDYPKSRQGHQQCSQLPLQGKAELGRAAARL